MFRNKLILILILKYGKLSVSCLKGAISRNSNCKLQIYANAATTYRVHGVHGFAWSSNLVILLKIDTHVHYTMMHVWNNYFFSKFLLLVTNLIHWTQTRQKISVFGQCMSERSLKFKLLIYATYYFLGITICIQDFDKFPQSIDWNLTWPKYRQWRYICGIEVWFRNSNCKL